MGFFNFSFSSFCQNFHTWRPSDLAAAAWKRRRKHCSSSGRVSRTLQGGSLPGPETTAADGEASAATTALDASSRCAFATHFQTVPTANGTPHQLGGEISPTLLHLQHLSYLDLSMNNFGGTQIPKFIGSLANLSYLNLSGSSFAGTIPPSLGNLSRLRYLDLSSDSFEPFESDLLWVSNLSSLKYLNLGGMDLSKATHHWLRTVNKLPSLMELQLPRCQLSQLPFSLPLVNLTSLSVLDLSNNGFDTAIPIWLFNLSGLSHLDLNSNNLQGVLPDAFRR